MTSGRPKARTSGQGSARPGGARVISLAGVSGMARRARASRPSRRTVVMLLAGVSVLVLVGYLFLASPLLTVKELQLVGGQRFGPAQLQALAAGDLGRPLALVDLGDLRDEVEQDPAVKTAQAVRVWPNTLEVRVIERVPMIAVPVSAQPAGDDDPKVDDPNADETTTQGAEGGDEPSSGTGDGFQLMDVDGVVVETVAEAPEGVAVVTPETVEAGEPAVLATAQVMQALPAELRGEVREASAASRDSVQLTMRVPVVPSAQDAQESAPKGNADETADEPAMRTVTVVWGGVEESALKAEVLAVLLGTDAVVYDVSSPATPVTRDSPLATPSSSPATADSNEAAGGGSSRPSSTPTSAAEATPEPTPTSSRTTAAASATPSTSTGMITGPPNDSGGAGDGAG
ncbi:MAG: cell division protein FtsQ/DivIB [Actinomycetales bacterium]